jgi:hypothetical protein
MTLLVVSAWPVPQTPTNRAYVRISRGFDFLSPSGARGPCGASVIYTYRHFPDLALNVDSLRFRNLSGVGGRPEVPPGLWAV